MRLDDILSAAGKHKRGKRVGRGRGSGCGKTSSRGHKGWGQRSGNGAQFGFEGGQNPMVRRMPKRGFNNMKFADVVEIVNVSDLQRCFEDGATVDLEALRSKRLVEGRKVKVKLLGKGELTHKLNVSVDCASKSAVEKVTAAGGQVQLASA